MFSANTQEGKAEVADELQTCDGKPFFPGGAVFVRVFACDLVCHHDLTMRACIAKILFVAS